MIEKRRTAIVAKRLQFQVVVSVMVSGLSIYIISTVGLRLLANQIFEVLELVEIKPELTMRFAESVTKSEFYFLGFTSLALILSSIAALYLSHRIGGPIYQINLVLDKRLAGNKEIRIKTRKNDFFHELVEKLNTILDEETDV